MSLSFSQYGVCDFKGRFDFSYLTKMQCGILRHSKMMNAVYFSHQNQLSLLNHHFLFLFLNPFLSPCEKFKD